MRIPVVALLLLTGCSGCAPGTAAERVVPPPGPAALPGTRHIPATEEPADPAEGGAVAAPAAPAIKVKGKVYDEKILAAASSYTSAELDAVRREYVFFGHQSVGGNILDGLEALGTAEPKYRLTRTYANSSDIKTFPGPALLDKEIGENLKPDTKIAEFSQVVTQLGPKVRIALMKLCFVDIDGSTDTAALAQRYVTAMQALERRQPGTTFVYTTAPIGPGGPDDTPRNAYNEMVRALAAGRPLFDIAAIEATRDGKPRCTFESGSKTLDRQCDEYSPGDPHINPAGGKRVAKAMTLMFADLLRP